MNTLGRLLRLTTWGESHGDAIGGVLDGFPSGISLDLSLVQQALDRRAPGRSLHTSPRREADQVEVLSGLFEGKTTGTPIAFIIRNSNQRSRDYEELREVFRPGHADITYQEKYGHRDHRGGGRASARETALRVVAGAMAMQWLREQYGVEIYAYADSIGRAKPQYLTGPYPFTREELIATRTDLLANPDREHSQRMLQEIEQARVAHNSVGGIISCIAIGVPKALGEPIYDKLEARLASAMLSINASRGFELGDGFAISELYGDVANDRMSLDATGVAYHSNHSGGTLGGISTGQDLCMRIAFKPAPSIGLAQDTCSASENKRISIVGRHDPCVIPRAIPVVEAMCALVLMDMCLLRQAYAGH